MSPHDTEQIEKFFSTIEPWFKAYSNIGLSYFAVKKGGEKYLLQARLFLNTNPSSVSAIRVETENILAGHFNFAEIGLSVQDFVNSIVGKSVVTTPFGKLIFPTEDKRELSAYFEPFHQEGISGGNRLPVLTISGARKYPFIELPKLDWELKAAPQPFDSIDELLTLLVLGGKRGDSATLEVVAYNPVVVNFNSIVRGTEAKPSVFLAKSLDSSKCQIGYRVFLHGKVVDRGAIQGDSLTWTLQGGHLQGEGWVGIPQGAVLHCVASYDGFAQHQYWIGDPDHSQNPRRVCFEASDEKLEILRDYLFEEQKPRKNARDFEFGVAWLMWMLGFSSSQIGGTANTSEAADIVATSPSGNILIVECTTGLLKSDKVAKLVERSEIVKKRLISSGNHHLKVLPVIVTSKPNNEVKADITGVERKGVAVVTKENLEALLSQTIVLTDAEPIFNQAWEKSQSAAQTDPQQIFGAGT